MTRRWLLSPTLCELLRAAGWEAVHWSTVGASDAPDRELMRWARENHHVVVTHDLDFNVLLATTGAGGPSVVQVRTQDVSPAVLDITARIRCGARLPPREEAHVIGPEPAKSSISRKKPVDRLSPSKSTRKAYSSGFFVDFDDFSIPIINWPSESTAEAYP